MNVLEVGVSRASRFALHKPSHLPPLSPVGLLQSQRALEGIHSSSDRPGGLLYAAAVAGRGCGCAAVAVGQRPRRHRAGQVRARPEGPAGPRQPLLRVTPPRSDPPAKWPGPRLSPSEPRRGLPAKAGPSTGPPSCRPARQPPHPARVESPRGPRGKGLSVPPGLRPHQDHALRALRCAVPFGRRHRAPPGPASAPPSAPNGRRQFVLANENGRDMRGRGETSASRGAARLGSA